MLRVRIDSKEINNRLGNAVKFSYGFLEGVDMGQIEFNQRLAAFTVEALGKYVDSHARMNPSALHHVYEWNAVGSEGGRLFSFKGEASKRVIHITGKFLNSTSVSETSTTPFTDKAEIMENGIAITISPKNGDVLAFEDDGEMVFTRNEIYIAHPGGDEVAGSFGRTVDEFFESYFSVHLLKPFLSALSRPKAFVNRFPEGVMGGGTGTGIKAGNEYLRSAGAGIE